MAKRVRKSEEELLEEKIKKEKKLQIVYCFFVLF